MKLIQKITVRDFYIREIGDLAKIYPKQLQKEVEKVEKYLAPEETEELWEYNDMSFLSGTRGLCVVKEGEILRSWAIFRS